MRYWVRYQHGLWYGPYIHLWEAESVAKEFNGVVHEVSPKAGVRSVD